MKDMMDNFKDDSILSYPIKVVMINSFEKKERGEDDGGLLRDALSAFWSEFYDSCTVGEDERVPVVRHDFKEKEWEAIARILVKGYQDVKFFPVKLNKVFLFAVLFDSRDMPEEMLLNSFLKYVSKDERDLIETALKDELDESQDDEWMGFLERFECRTVPTKEKRKTVILELAHKEMVQIAQYVIDSWQKPVKDRLTGYDCFASKESFEKFYESCKPTVKKVLSMIKAKPENNSQRAALSYLQRYIRGLDDEKLTKFLRFCTSATMLCVESIEVTFTDLDGAARRPVAHTCGSVLELPTTYQSFPQLRQEMNAIFSSEYWDIDIA